MTVESGISIILPISGDGKFLEPALKSILRQEIPEPFEIIVVLDEVTPDVYSILDQFPSSKFKFAESKLHGVAHAHNTGLEAAVHDLIAVTHSDDVSLPRRFLKQSIMLREFPELVCVGGQLTLVDEKESQIGIARYLIDPIHVRKAFRHKSAIAHPAAMYRRDVALQAGGYRQHYAPAEDLDLWLRMLDFGEMSNVASSVVRYRSHEKQTSRASLSKQSRAKIQVYWDRKHSLGLLREDTTRIQKLFLRILAQGETSLVHSVNYGRSSRYLNALFFFFVASIINPHNVWLTLLDFIKVRLVLKKSYQSENSKIL